MQDTRSVYQFGDFTHGYASFRLIQTRRGIAREDSAASRLKQVQMASAQAKTGQPVGKSSPVIRPALRRFVVHMAFYALGALQVHRYQP